MTTTKDLQKQLTEALIPLKHHPEVQTFLPYLQDENNDIFISYLPYEKDFSKMTANEQEQLKYYKAFWIINELIASDPSILDDKKSEALRKVAIFCYSNATQLHDIYGAPLETLENDNSRKKQETRKPSQHHTK